ncbi:cellulase family glycosylhydrolase [Alloacidobacterium dinghuense]|uniref:cellulase n=1 Tax=Alloacidobacterium dinghuense TaxID=2763107 RepID=A0A7G8BIC6_9BACT|nr:cellulase family glycosylhydrolase [Alloacidobacterium dinghuense]QNI32296.1 cellulase family glycosylhydrolase [Alloacidobacterium dinghuense]
MSSFSGALKELLTLTQMLVLLLVSGAQWSHAQASPQLPLHTSGYKIVDAKKSPVQLKSVNWYGFDEKEYVPGGLDHAPLATIVGLIKRMGFNSVRLPWANETLEKNPVVADYAIKANPQLRGKHAMEVMDIVIDALAKAQIMVILDNHVSRADWCCKDDDGNGLWYSKEYPESAWLADWKTIARRYRNQPWVVGVDLRNELRSGAVWGGDNKKLDWHAAATRGGNAVLSVSPKLLVMIEGPQYSTDFRGAAHLPVFLDVPNRAVYSPHAYSFGAQTQNYAELQKAFDERAGFLLQTTPAIPLWIGEFGTCQTLTGCGSDPNGEWIRGFVRYVKEHPELGWSYWPLNGTQSSGYSRTYDAPETFGLLTTDYQHIAAPKLLELFRTIGLQPQE